MDPGMYQLVCVVAQTRSSEQGKAVIGLIIAEKSSTRKLEIHSHAYHDGIPVNHLLQACRLQIDMVESGLSDGVALNYF